MPQLTAVAEENRSDQRTATKESTLLSRAQAVNKKKLGALQFRFPRQGENLINHAINDRQDITF